MIIGVTQALTRGLPGGRRALARRQLPRVMPYVVMIVILLVRPYGLFGTPEVRQGARWPGRTRT